MRLQDTWTYEELLKEDQKEEALINERAKSRPAALSEWRLERFDSLLNLIVSDPQARSLGVALIPLPNEYPYPWVKRPVHFILKRIKNPTLMNSPVAKLITDKSQPPCLGALKYGFPKANVPPHLGDLCPICEIDPVPFTLYHFLAVKLQWIDVSGKLTVSPAGDPFLASLNTPEKSKLLRSGQFISPETNQTHPVAFFSSSINVPQALNWSQGISFKAISPAAELRAQVLSSIEVLRAKDPASLMRSILFGPFRDLLYSPNFYQEVAIFYAQAARAFLAQEPQNGAQLQTAV